MPSGHNLGNRLPAWWKQLMASERREMQRILAEFLSMRGVLPLLMKARNGGQWTAAEKAELLRHLRRLSHLSPYLLLLILPGSALLLPAYAWWLDRRRLRRGHPKPPVTTAQP